LEAPATSLCQTRHHLRELGGEPKSDFIKGQNSQDQDTPGKPVENSSASPGTSVTLTGILLVDDFRCDERSADVPKDKMFCPDGSPSQWGFITATRQYTVRGTNSELRKYERRRVTVTGTVTAGDKRDLPIDKLLVRSIASSEVDANPIRALIEQLRSNPWTEPRDLFIPTSWFFRLTPPMIQILQVGPAAQDVLLEYINDSQIKDQVIFLLGGVGNGDAVEPIIEAMATPNEAHGSAYARKINLAANLALTNITVGDVIWHHGGGITMDACPNDPKSCWSEWWTKHRDTFDISHTFNRRYSNYPDYGIYRSPSGYNSEEFIHNSKDN
jgi:hypothetical protein